MIGNSAEAGPGEVRFDAAIERVGRAVAMAGGLLLVGVMAMTVISVIGRYAFNAPIPGDYEITELVCGVAVFAFFPYCHLRNANIVVEFFTAKLSPRRKTALDTVHSFAFAVVAGLIAWRLLVGGLHKLADEETTLFLDIPIYWGYFPALLGAVLLTVVCVWVLWRHIRMLRR
ncbi:MAG: TRAP transporter small permease [Defluviicoccus sp.]|nr:TRAP transporter small permease [Defluviicoccus sp.]